MLAVMPVKSGLRSYGGLRKKGNPHIDSVERNGAGIFRVMKKVLYG